MAKHAMGMPTAVELANRQNAFNRAAVIDTYSIVDTPPEPAFDDLVALASSICEMPISQINFLLEHRQWTKAGVGTDFNNMPVSLAFCAHVVASKSVALFEVPDATQDDRFAGHPMVVGAPGLRYYAGIPLVSREGTAIGALCVLDTKPRPAGLTGVQRQTLSTLANQVSAQLELRRALAERDAHALKQRSTTAELRWIALHDPLTGLANRDLFQRRLEQAVKRKNDHSRTALMMLDVDHFKQINDTLGHAAGDSMLQVVAERLRAVVRSTDTVARLGGDEFGIILENIAGPCHVEDVARAILERLQQPIDYDGQQIDVRLTIGAAIFPDHTTTATDLIRYADVALYVAKAAGRGRSAIFEPTMLQDAQRKATMIRHAREVLMEGAVTPWYQPQIDLDTGRVTGLEALLRVREADGRFEPPGHIIAAFENTELAIRLGDTMINRVAADMRDWLDAGLEFGRVAINASASEFRDDGYADRLLGVLAAKGVPATCVDLEVTETVFLDRAGETVERALSTLVAAGVRVALDDFGTGYASLSHLGRFPVNVLKIDRSFVHGLGQGGGSRVIVNAILDIATSLGLETIAEGIETAAEADYLRRRGCDIGQGFFYSAAIPASKVRALLLRNGAKYGQFAVGENAFATAA